MVGQIYPTELQPFRCTFSRLHDKRDDFDFEKKITAKLLKQGYRYPKIRKAFSKFYH